MVNRPTILMVEGNTDLLEIFQLMLTSKGFSITTAQSAEEAITTLESERPVAIITALKLPKMSGLDFIRHVRNTPELASIPIVVASSLATDHLEEARQAGATEVLRRPVDFSALAKILNQL
jgi:CheY-like chemotaxis protein